MFYQVSHILHDQYEHKLALIVGVLYIILRNEDFDEPLGGLINYFELHLSPQVSINYRVWLCSGNLGICYYIYCLLHCSENKLGTLCVCHTTESSITTLTANFVILFPLGHNKHSDPKYSYTGVGDDCKACHNFHALWCVWHGNYLDIHSVYKLNNFLCKDEEFLWLSEAHASQDPSCQLKKMM